MLTSGRSIFFALLALHVAVYCVREAPAAGGPLWEEVNPKEAPHIWKHLANERLMYPMDMGNIAAKIGPERQLFVDNYLIAEASKVTREVHQARRYEGNPILSPTFSGRTVQVKHVLQFKESPRFRMWYTATHGFSKWKNGGQIRFATGYAVSEDGMHWNRPELNLYDKDFPEPNIVLPYGFMAGLFYEPWEPDPQKRFKALLLNEAFKTTNGKREYMIREGFYLAWSPDGIHWKVDLEKMVIPSAAARGFPMTGIGDTTAFWWDSIHKKYIGDVKWILLGPKRRFRGIMESDDLVHWTRAYPTFVAIDPGNQIYGHRGFVYEGMYIGLRWLMPERLLPEVHAMELALDCSRDGTTWTRVGTDQPFMAINPKRDTWDSDQAAANAMLVVGDEIFIYYCAQSAPQFIANYKDNKLGFTSGTHRAGLAKLRLDGFASLNGGVEAGTVVTRPLTFKGRTLHVNAEVAEGGELRVGFRTRDGKKPVKGFAVADGVPLTGDKIDMPVRWRGGANVSSLGGTPSRIEFRLRQAKIYSFWIE